MDPELKKLLDELNKKFADFTAKNDERLATIEKKGAADPLTEETVNKLNAEITRVQKEMKARVDEIEKRANRPAQGTGEAGERELKTFNHALKSHAMRLGRALPATLDAEGYQAYKAGFENWMRKGRDDLDAVEAKALSVGVDPQGGYLVPTTLETAIDRVVSRISAMRRLATVRPIGTGSYTKPVVTAGASYGWAGETSAPTETGTPTLAELEFVPGKLWAQPYATTDLLEDAVVDIEGWLAEEVQTSFAEGEGDGFINGTGVNKPRGLLSYSIVANASYAWGSLGYIASGAAADFASSTPSDKLFDLQHALKRQYRPGAAWLMNDATLGKIRKFKDGQNNYLWKPGLEDGVVGQLLGYPVETDDFMPDVAADAYSLAFGNFKRGYLVVDRRGIVVLRDPFTSKPYVKFYTTRRVGGGVQNFEAIKLMKIASS
ncbi:MAG: phage major capsid protein [Alphaproteobacteria bacterium]|nr:phage major capsid protein [Alphaproteobacteria bacterium]